MSKKVHFFVVDALFVGRFKENYFVCVKLGRWTEYFWLFSIWEAPNKPAPSLSGVQYRQAHRQPSVLSASTGA